MTMPALNGVGRLWVCLLGSTGLYWILTRLDAVNGRGPVLRFLGLMALLFILYAVAARAVAGLGDRRGVLAAVAFGALAFRLALLPAGLPPGRSASDTVRGLADDLAGRAVRFERFQLYDDDLWRYLWDGHVLAHGGNPFALPPAHSALEPLADPARSPVTDHRSSWSDVRDNINHPETPTVYPVLAQALFLLAHALSPGSVLAWKLLVVALDLLAILFMAMALRAQGRPAALVALYAWNPLVVKVFAGSGHVDVLAVALLALLALALLQGRTSLAALAFSGAALAKLAPLVLLPFLARRLGWRRTGVALGLVGAGVLAQLVLARHGGGGLGAMARDWRFNAGVFGGVEASLRSLTDTPGLAARVVVAGLLLVVLACLARRDDGARESLPALAASALGALLLLSPAVMPWYVTWILPFALLADRKAWFAVTFLLGGAFLVMIDGVERPLVLALEHSLILAVLALGGSPHALLDRLRAAPVRRPRLRPGLALDRRPRLA